MRNALTVDAGNSPNVGQLWAEANRTVTADAPLVPLVIPSYVKSVSKRVGNS